MYSRNISSLLLLMVKEGRLEPNFEDPILQGCCITRDGQVVHAATRALLQ
jgi:NAD(P) transhydrogenase subunit alpha